MHRCRLTFGNAVSSLAIWIAFAVVLHSDARTAHAGIQLPQQVGFDAKDLEQSLDDEAGAGSSSSSQRNSDSWPPTNNDDQPNPLGLLNSPLPTSNSSSSSSSSSAGGATGSGVVLCLFNGTIALTDDACLGRLAEDHGLSLPDPPGTDLLRPPRC